MVRDGTWEQRIGDLLRRAEIGYNDYGTGPD